MRGLDLDRDDLVGHGRSDGAEVVREARRAERLRVHDVPQRLLVEQRALGDADE